MRGLWSLGSLCDTRAVKSLWLLAVILVTVYAPLLGGRVIYNRDVARFVYPIRWFVRDCIERGQWPWWNPDIGLGFSTLADPQYGLFYPPNLLHLVGPLPVSVMLVMLLHLVGGAFGMALLGRSFGLRREATLVAGLAWALSGYVASLWTTGCLLTAATWIPWQAFAFVHLAGRVAMALPWRRAAAGLAAAIGAAFLCGEPFVAAMGVLLGLGMALLWLLAEFRDEGDHAGQPAIRVLRRFGGAVIGAGLSGLALAAVGLLPAALAITGTERRGGLDAAVAESGSLHVGRLIDFVAAGATGKAWAVASDAPWVHTLLDGRPLSMSLYLGGSVLALVLVAFVRRRDRAWVQVWGLAVLAVLSLLLAMGRHTPVHALARVLLPPLAYMRAPEKYLLMLVPCLALLAGFGAQRLLSGAAERVHLRIAVLLALLLATAVLAPLVLEANLGGFVRSGSLHAMAAAAGVLVISALLVRHGRVAGGALVVLVAGDLALGSGFLLRFGEPSLFTAPPPLARTIHDDFRRAGRPSPRLFRGSMVQESATRADPQPTDRLTFNTLRDNISVPFGIAILPGYEVAAPPALGRLLGHGRRELLRLLSIDYALLSDRGGAPPPGLRALASPVPGVRLFGVAGGLPRAFLSFHAERLPANQIQSRLLDEDVTAGREILLDDSSPAVVLPAAKAEPVACAIEAYTTTRLSARCVADRPAMAVFVEQQLDGWSATVDDAPASLLPVNTLMRGVPVPPGSHSIALTFSPPGLLVGSALSLAGLLLLAWLAIGPISSAFVGWPGARRCRARGRNSTAGSSAGPSALGAGSPRRQSAPGSCAGTCIPCQSPWIGREPSWDCAGAAAPGAHRVSPRRLWPRRRLSLRCCSWAQLRDTAPLA